MKHKSERYKSRRVTPWDDQIEKTPTQKFVTKVTRDFFIRIVDLTDHKFKII